MAGGDVRPGTGSLARTDERPPGEPLAWSGAM